MPARGKALKGFIFLILGFFFIFVSSKLWAMELVLSRVPSEIEVKEEFQVHFYFQTTVKKGKYYLRPCFYLAGTHSYFGCIKNNQGDWICGAQSDKTVYFEIETNYEGIWEGDLSIKADSGDGDYELKIRRYTAGGSNEDSNSVSIKILGLTPPSTPTPASSPSPSPTPACAASTATYKINEVKDENGNILSSVKVYVDEVYIHHYVPETLTFCGDCQCDTYANCGFGKHTIKLEKSGFADWSETKTINVGDTYEVNPVMNQTNSDSSPTPSSTPSPKPIEVTGATLLGKILGEEVSPAGFYPWEATEEAKSQEATESSRTKFIPKLFLGLGLVFVVSSGVWIWYTQLG